MDDLGRIERCYGSVAEYNRSRWEDEEYEAEQQAKRWEYCKANKAKLEAAGERALYFCDDCFGCKFYEDVGPTSWDSWGQDDVPHGICHHKGNWYKDDRNCKGREEGKYE